MAFFKPVALEYFERAVENQRLGHAYLITGPQGAGKRDLVREICQLVIKGTSEQFESFQHPNIHVIEPESKSRRIRVEQLRSLEHRLQMTAGNGRKTGIIFDADRMQPQAANAFLKTLEEPPENSLLLLVTERPELLLDTILSRCISVPLQAEMAVSLNENEQQILDMLREYFRRGNFSIGHALTLLAEFQSILSAIKNTIKKDFADDLKVEHESYKETTDGRWLSEREEFYAALTESQYLLERSRLMEMFLQWWAELLRHRNEITRIDFPDLAEELAPIAQNFSSHQIIQKIETLETLRDQLQTNVNESLAMEATFIRVFAEAG